MSARARHCFCRCGFPTDAAAFRLGSSRKETPFRMLRCKVPTDRSSTSKQRRRVPDRLGWRIGALHVRIGFLGSGWRDGFVYL